MGVTLHHVLQPAPLVRDMDVAIDYVQTLFGMYPSERVRITPAGIDNAVYALGGMTFLELIAPYDPDRAAWRLLAKRGPGWHMASFDLAPDEPADVDGALSKAGMRATQRNNQQGTLAWHLHPKDTGGVLVLVARRKDPDDNSLYAGPAWRQYVATNSRVVDGIAGISWIAPDADELADLLAERFVLDFGPSDDDGDSRARTATLASGAFVQARAPAASNGAAQAYVDRCGSGLYHLAFGLSHRSELDRRLGVLGLEAEERKTSAGTSLWLNPHEPLAIPIEFLTSRA